jgi:ABC-2 type transport system permease protein
MIFYNLVKQALKAKRTLWATYSAMGLGFLLLYISVFPSIQDQSASYKQIFATLPKGLMLAFNITDAVPTLMGYLSSKHFGLVWLLMIILLVISYGSFVIAKEVETRTMGFLLSQPINRVKLYLARFSAGTIGLAVFIVVSEVVAWPLAKAFSYSIDLKGVLLVGLAGFLFGLSVLGLSFMISAMSSSAARVSAWSGVIVLAMYAIFIASSLVAELDNLKYLSLFHYFSPGDIVTNNSISLSSIIVFVLFAFVTATIGAVIFQKRQIQI